MTRGPWSVKATAAIEKAVAMNTNGEPASKGSYGSVVARFILHSKLIVPYLGLGWNWSEAVSLSGLVALLREAHFTAILVSTTTLICGLCRSLIEGQIAQSDRSL